MSERTSPLNSIIIGLALVAGLALFGYLLGRAAINVKEYERSVTVKGLAEREVPADIVLWPIVFTVTDNDLGQLYASIDESQRKIVKFLVARGIDRQEISSALPSITDKSAQQYGGSARPEFRFVATQTVTVYSARVAEVRQAMAGLAELGKSGIVFSGQNMYGTEYLFTRLNKIKPQMIEEATAKAREVAEKFAADSQSRLGRIKSASQGQFSITPRDNNNPHLKKVRVVSTVEYYLAD